MVTHSHLRLIVYALGAALLLSCVFATAFSQPTDFQFERLTIKDGLSNNRVISICQDSLGFMWFGTEDGLNRYDGRTIKVYRRIEGDSTSLQFNYVRAIHTDQNGNLWVVAGALHRYDRENDRFIRYSPDPDSPKSPQGHVMCVFIDQYGILWIGSEAGLDRFDPGTEVFSRIDIGGPMTILSMADDHDGNRWLGTNLPMVIRLNKNTLQFERLPDPRLLEVHQLYADKSIVWIADGTGLYQVNPQGKPKVDSTRRGSVMAVCEDGEGRFWLGTFSEGLELFDRTTRSSITFSHSSSDSRSLCSPFIEGLHVDRQGNLWVATSHGISFLSNWRKKFRHFVHNTDNPNSVVDGEVHAIMEDSRGDRWIGTWGGGLSRWDHRTGILQNYKQEGGLQPWLSDLYEDRNGTVWIGSNGFGGLLRWDQQSKTFSQVSLDVPGKRRNAAVAILEDSHGAFWVGTGDGVWVYDRRTGGKRWYTIDTAGSRQVWEIYEDHGRRIWLSTSSASGGLYEYDRVHDRFVRQHDVAAWSIHEDRTNRMWLGTSQGLMRFDQNSDSLVSVLTDSNGLSGENVFGILEDNQSNLWLSTNKGLTKFNPDSRALRNYGINDGYPFSGITHQGYGYHGYHKGRNGEMMFGVGNGFVVFHPDDIRDNPNVPAIVITDFKLFNESVGIAPDSPLKTNITEAKSISLSHNQNIISFSFSVLDYTITANNKYAYQLEGFDEDWVHVGTRNFAQYTNLSPGKYTFKVKGSNSDGVWNERGTFINIIITPPWWKTIWAYLGYGFVIVGLFYSIRRSEKHRDGLKHQAELEHARAESLQEVDSLKSRFFANISHEFRTPLTLILGPISKWRELLARMGTIQRHPERTLSERSEPKGESKDVLSREHASTPSQLGSVETALSMTRIVGELPTDLGMMERNAQRLLRLINQLLDLSKLEGGAMKLQASRGNIVAFVKGLASSFESSANVRRVTIDIRAERDDVEMYFDRDKMEKILTNLLSNAFKFTPEGGRVEVNVLCRGGSRSAPTEHKSVEITIADTGIGIPADELPRVFDRFYQVDSSQTREHEGSGIGLALTKELVELHHGSISVTSEVGKGTEFTVQLPLGRDHLKDEEIIDEEDSQLRVESLRATDLSAISLAERSEAIPHMDQIASARENVPRNDTTPLVLVVEDNADVRAYMREYLVTGYDVQEAHDGAEGIEKAKEIIPDLIISDVMMPKKDGYELCKALKLDEKTSHIPIILLTAKAGIENKIEGLETGADDYLTKPFDAKELLVRVKNLIDLRRKLRDRFSVGQVLKPGDIAVTSVDDAFLQKAMSLVEQRMGDEEFGVEQMRNELGMSRTQLHRKLTALTNQSAGDFIRYMRLQRSKDLLKQNAGTVSEIAYQVGFNSVAYFTKCFREQFGVVPSEVRTPKA